ncbi:PRC-barrel domain-containing protein [Pseudonocardia saturnea]
MIIAENRRDWRGKKVIDPDGARIGELEAVYVDTVSDEAAFVTSRWG